MAKVPNRIGYAVRVGITLALVLLCRTEAFALVSFDPIDWDGGGLESWDERDDVTLGDKAATIANPSTYLQLTVDGPAEPGSVGNAMVVDYAAAEDFTDQAGKVVRSVLFDFDGYPTAIQNIYFASSFGTGSEWVSDSFVSDGVDGFQSYAVGFTEASSWDDFNGTGISFADALTEVTRIGVEVFAEMAAGQSFIVQLDNWQFSEDTLAVPEPGTILMSLTALLGMFGACRRQIFDGLASLRGTTEAV